MLTIKNVLNKLTEEQLKGIANRRAKRKRRGPVKPSAESLATSYKDDWSELLKDMNKTELLRILTVLDTNDLRVFALRAFDGREVTLNKQKQTPEGIIKKLCHTAPEKLQKTTWEKIYAKMLQDVGWRSERIPEGLEDSVRLQRIFE